MTQDETESVMPFGELRREMDRLFDGFVGGVKGGLNYRSQGDPPVNLWEDTNALHVEFELPGLDMSDIDVQIARGELTISGQRTPMIAEGVTLHRQERARGDFARSVSLPAEIDAEKVEAVLKDGLLRVTLPKTESLQPRKIVVKGE